MFLQTQARYYQYEQGDVQASSGNIMQIPAMSKSVPKKLKINVLRRVANSAFSAWTRSWWASCNTLLMTVAISFREGHSVFAGRYPSWASGSCMIIVARDDLFFVYWKESCERQRVGNRGIVEEDGTSSVRLDTGK